MYKELLLKLTKDNKWVKIQPPCPEDGIVEAEGVIGCRFPSELRALLSELNGDGWFLLSAEGMVENVLRNRKYFPDCFDTEEEYLERIDRHIFFATNGCGDYYCYKITKDGAADTSCVYIWEHELFDTRRVADNLTDAIQKYYNSEI